MIYKPRDHWHMDVMISGVRYREGLHTTDRREALRLEKKRVSGDGPPFIRLGRIIVYDSRDLDVWLASRRRSSTSETDNSA